MAWVTGLNPSRKMPRMKSHKKRGQSLAKPNKPWRFWLAGSYFAIVLVFVVCWIVFVFSPVNTQIIKQQTNTLTITAKACAEAIEHTSDLTALVSKTTENSDLRITVITRDGSVLADSDFDPQNLENHLQREEVQEALAGGVGVTQRESASDGQMRLYVALSSTCQGNEVVVRLSEPLSSIQIMTDSVAYTALILIALGVAIALVIAFLSIKQSATPIKALEQVRTDFVANASHELKTPVAGIRLLSEAIQDAAEMNDTKTLTLFTQRLNNESERLQRLVVDLLDLSRLESQETSSTNPRADIHSTLVTSYVAHKNQAEDKSLTVTFIDKCLPNDNCYANMEPSDASLIFDNLIENAIMYTDKGCITITLEVHTKDILITVEDSGIGIPQADQARIFERFYRVDKARSREVGGTGLGLSLVRHAVERAEGTIKVKSEVGKGTRFSVYLPKRMANGK